MLLILFISLMAISIVIVAIGYWKEIYMLQIIGYTLILLLSLPLFGSGINYKSGEILNKTSIQMIDSSNITHISENTTVTYQYSNYDDYRIYFYLVVMAMLGITTTLIHIKTGKEEL